MEKHEMTIGIPFTTNLRPPSARDKSRAGFHAVVTSVKSINQLVPLAHHETFGFPMS
jgi:hypothetical protein